MNRRRVRTFLVGVLLVAATSFAGSTPAAAGTLPTAHAGIGVGYPTTTTFHVCASGSNDDGFVGEWVLEIHGMRSDGSLIEYQDGGWGATYNTCVSPNISTNGTLAGSFNATLLYAHIGPSGAASAQATGNPELTAVAVEVVDWNAAWNPPQNNEGFGM
jgi:hypothetical protein